MAWQRDDHGPVDVIDNKRWREGIESLILALWEMRDVLDIFAQPVASALKGYVAGEVESYYRPTAIRVEELGQEELRKYELLVSSVWTDSYETKQFDAALDSLRKFVQENLKPEDVY